VPPPAALPSSVTPVALPGGGPDGISMDYLTYDPRTNSVWVPAGNTASVDVVDVATDKVQRIEGFATAEIERNGKKRTAGPSAAALGPTGTVYIGNRGDTSVCAIDEKTLAKGACGKLDASPDGVAYVAKTGEVWVTTPRDKSIRVLDAKTLAEKGKVELDGGPEGFAADNARGRFYTNLEDKDEAVAIDLATRKPVATWKLGCGEGGPHGLRMAEGFLLVGCTEKLEVVDVAHDGKVVGSIDTGHGVDDFEYLPATHSAYVAASKAGHLVVATLDPKKGGLTLVKTTPTAVGARNGVVTGDGVVYIAYSAGSELLKVATK
jgi:DNA-binding beta-propeller fold protein YncE